MAYLTKNIIVGAAKVYVSVNDSTDSAFYGANDEVAVTLPSGLAASVSSVAAFDADTANWRHVGFTSDGVELTYEPNFGEVEVDQLLDAAKLFKQGMTASLRTSLAEATLENLVLAWGQKGSSLGAPDDVDASTADELGIESGALLDEPVERSVAFIGPAPRSATGLKRERLYVARRALNVESVAIGHQKTEATMIPVSLRLLPDPYYTGKEYGIIRDRNIES